MSDGTIPKTVGLCPDEVCGGEFYMPDAKQGDRCPMDHSFDDDGAPELVIFYPAPGAVEADE
jgi:hypothetical protein